MIAAVAALAVALTQAPAAGSANPLDGFTVGGALKWSMPKARYDLSGFYPERSDREGKSGRVTLVCVLTDGQIIKGCKVVEETTKNAFFADAAMKIAPLIVIDSNEAEQAGSWVVLSVNFKNAKVAADLKRLTPSQTAP
jgi:hypothetical protein